MLIAIDARELCGRPTGVGRYLAHLLEAWARLPEASAHRLVLYVRTRERYHQLRTAFAASLRDGEITATQGICTHEYFELDKGFLTAGTLTCALHLSRFDLSNGEPLDPPAELPLVVYPVVVENGRILIEVPDGPLEVNE